MNVLVIGSGGREHAIAWKLANCADVDTVFVAPGNPGTQECAENVAIAADDLPALVRFAIDKQIDLTVVGPEKPLVDGIVDLFRLNGLPIVGPSALAARLEGSKAYAKEFMARHDIPTAAFRSFHRDEYAEALAYLEAQSIPIVIKASGLAAGKGAVVCLTRAEAEATLAGMLIGGAFGDATDEIVIEEFMVGEEASFFVLCDGMNYAVFPSAQDHKQIGEGDTGPNTGGMGAYSPAPVLTDDIARIVQQTIVDRVLEGMIADGSPYTGFLFVGLMLTADGPKVVEFNCRLGDPETQVILALLKSDFSTLLFQSATSSITDSAVEFVEGSAACVVVVSDGYPGAYEKGKSIQGIEDATGLDGTQVIQAGTAATENGIVSNGGRVLSVVGLGMTLEQSLQRAYAGVGKISFDGATYRKDIGAKGLRWISESS